MPHGWGHDKPGTRLSVAREHAGVNSNILSPGDFVDVLSGNAAVNGIPVTVTGALAAARSPRCDRKRRRGTASRSQSIRGPALKRPRELFTLS
jgi:hypothetical protein